MFVYAYYTYVLLHNVMYAYDSVLLLLSYSSMESTSTSLLHIRILAITLS